MSGYAAWGGKRYYACVRCQATHYEGAALYRQHKRFQSKHGVRRTSERLWAIERLRDWLKEETV